MNILVTGSAGYIGTVLCEHLQKLGHTVIGFDIRNHSEQDILNVAVLESVFATQQLDVCVHLAALKSVAESVGMKQEYLDVGITGTQHVADLCQTYQVKLIFTSTIAVNEPNLNPYAQSKLLAEQYITKNCDNYLIVRLSNVVGFIDGHEDYVLNGHSLVDNILSAVLNHEVLNVYGDCVRNYVFIEHVVECLIQLIETQNQIVSNVCSSLNLTTLEFVQAFEQYTNVTVQKQFAPAREFEPSNISCDGASTDMAQILTSLGRYLTSSPSQA